MHRLLGSWEKNGASRYGSKFPGGSWTQVMDTISHHFSVQPNVEEAAPDQNPWLDEGERAEVGAETDELTSGTQQTTIMVAPKSRSSSSSNTTIICPVCDQAMRNDAVNILTHLRRAHTQDPHLTNRMVWNLGLDRCLEPGCMAVVHPGTEWRHRRHPSTQNRLLTYWPLNSHPPPENMVSVETNQGPSTRSGLTRERPITPAEAEPRKRPRTQEKQPEAHTGDVSRGDVSSVSGNSTHSQSTVQAIGSPSQERGVAIFWDTQTCPLPPEHSAFSVAAAIRGVGWGACEVLFAAYADRTQFTDKTRQQFLWSNVVLRETVDSGAGSVARLLLLDLHRHTLIHSASSCAIVVVTGDVELVSTLLMLREVGTYRLGVVRPQSAPCELNIPGTHCLTLEDVVRGTCSTACGTAAAAISGQGS